MAVTAAAWMAGCAPMRVSSHVDRGADFTRYRTFDWGTADAYPETDPRFERNAFYQDHVQGAIEREMQRKGFARSEREAPPDVRVHFHAVVERRLDVNRLDYRDGVCARSDCGIGVNDYEQGTLVVDVVDGRTNKLVWRGWAQDTLGDALENQDHLASKIEQAVARMFVRLPAAR
jgi:hypothetical protein